MVIFFAADIQNVAYKERKKSSLLQIELPYCISRDIFRASKTLRVYLSLDSREGFYLKNLLLTSTPTRGWDTSMLLYILHIFFPFSLSNIVAGSRKEEPFSTECTHVLYCSTSLSLVVQAHSYTFTKPLYCTRRGCLCVRIWDSWSPVSRRWVTPRSVSMSRRWWGEAAAHSIMEINGHEGAKAVSFNCIDT